MKTGESFYVGRVSFLHGELREIRVNSALTLPRVRVPVRHLGRATCMQLLKRVKDRLIPQLSLTKHTLHLIL